MSCNKRRLKLSKDIKMVVSDFDGVFTDGTFLIDENLNQQKSVNFVDIMGVSLLLKKGILFGIISGETSNILEYFRHKFGVEEIHKGIRQKGIVLSELMKKYNLKSDEVLYIGDDINDIAAFECVDYKIAPSNANPVVKVIKGIQITEKSGGKGAFREMVDELLWE